MASINALRGLQHALTLQTATGPVTLDPSQDPEGYARMLGESYDTRVAAQRASADATEPLTSEAPGRNYGLEQTIRAQQDAATGPAGWNRQWVPFLEAPQVQADNMGMTSRIGGIEGLPESPSATGLASALKARKKAVV